MPRQLRRQWKPLLGFSLVISFMLTAVNLSHHFTGRESVPSWRWLAAVAAGPLLILVSLLVSHLSLRFTPPLVVRNKTLFLGRWGRIVAARQPLTCRLSRDESGIVSLSVHAASWFSKTQREIYCGLTDDLAAAEAFVAAFNARFNPPAV